jgi:UDP-N-acetylmuramoylalanine--D-glutamate ligase
MIPMPLYRNRAIAILGLARSGLAAARSLRAGGASVLCWDDAAARRAEAKSEGFEVRQPAAGDNLAALVASPGVPLEHPMIAAVRDQGIEVLGDVELLWRALPEPRYIAVTGTNGKSTTTALIGHLLTSAGNSRVQTGGNLGTPALDLAPVVGDGTLVLELSSYQLDLTIEATFDIAVLLNVAPDHLDRHGSMSSYVAAKRQIFRPGRLKTAIVGIDDLESREIRDMLDTRRGVTVVPVSPLGKLSQGVSVADGILYEDGARICDLSDALALPGTHNWQNAAAAYAVGRACGVAPAVLVPALLNFGGLPHRMERVACVDGIPIINDSKATNAEAAAQALACYERIYWIAGGRPKSDGIASLKKLFPRIAHAFLIGEAEDGFAETLEGALPVTRCGTLDRAVSAALDAARGNGRAGTVVLFSPACASFDQFENFEQRGDAFRALFPVTTGIEAKGVVSCAR